MIFWCPAGIGGIDVAEQTFVLSVIAITSDNLDVEQLALLGPPFLYKQNILMLK